jgi:hypothetical membrane protein
MTFTNKTRAGALIFIGTVWFLMGIIVCEALYPGYHVTQMISDLGVGTTAPLYNASIIVFGILLIAAAYLLRKEGTDPIFSVLLALVGIGAVGVGIFPENTGTPHIIAALTVFVIGGVCAIISFRIFPAPWAWFSGALGVITLVALVLLGAKLYFGLGPGGMERMVAYPVLFWALASGAVLMVPER